MYQSLRLSLIKWGYRNENEVMCDMGARVEGQCHALQGPRLRVQN